MSAVYGLSDKTLASSLSFGNVWTAHLKPPSAPEKAMAGIPSEAASAATPLYDKLIRPCHRFSASGKCLHSSRAECQQAEVCADVRSGEDPIRFGTPKLSTQVVSPVLHSCHRVRVDVVDASYQSWIRAKHEEWFSECHSRLEGSYPMAGAPAGTLSYSPGLVGTVGGASELPVPL